MTTRLMDGSGLRGAITPPSWSRVRVGPGVGTVIAHNNWTTVGFGLAVEAVGGDITWSNDDNEFSILADGWYAFDFYGTLTAASGGVGKSAAGRILDNFGVVLSAITLTNDGAQGAFSVPLHCETWLAAGQVVAADLWHNLGTGFTYTVHSDARFVCRRVA